MPPAARLAPSVICSESVDERFFVAGPHRAGVLIKRGAEAELRRTEFLGRPAVDKVRVPKSYRLTELDDGLRRSRIRIEARLMAEARAAGVPVPIIYDIDLVEAKIVMEYVSGPTLKEVLDRRGSAGLEVAREMGRVIGRLHRAGIVHGDLTTSNMLWRDGRIVMIDFSLGGKDRGREARGVDLHLLREGLVSAHARATAYYREVVGGFPGVYSSYVHKRLGNPGLLKLLQDAKTRAATFETVFLLRQGGSHEVFHGECRGTIAAGERGTGGFGFDPIFVPEGAAKTFAEMTVTEKNRVSHRARAVAALLAHLRGPKQP